jgi:polysaccharide biosynthesis protein PslH
MKILWVKADFLHPTTRGAQIRTLEIVRRLHQRHELHYLAFEDPDEPDGPGRSCEYSAKHFSVPHTVAEKKLTSPAFVGELVAGLVSPLPVAVARWRSVAMKREVERLERQEKYDAVVCDFLFPASNIPDLSRVVLFQHNVEAVIWRRHAEQAGNWPKRLYFQLQAKKMADFEGEICRKAKRVIAVSDIDAEIMRREYGVKDVQPVPTGVDVDYFRRSPADRVESKADLMFVGSMDWMPNSSGIKWFVHEILPLIEKQRPGTTLAIVGRKPGSEIEALASRTVTVTGTVPDVRPWLWGSKVSVVPLRVGGGTRLKIYEAMAAEVPVVSTSIGAEGLETVDGGNIAIADSSQFFADRCVELLNDADARKRMARQALDMVAERYSWEGVTAKFENLLK